MIVLPFTSTKFIGKYRDDLFYDSILFEITSLIQIWVTENLDKEMSIVRIWETVPFIFKGYLTDFAVCSSRLSMFGYETNNAKRRW